MFYTDRSSFVIVSTSSGRPAFQSHVACRLFILKGLDIGLDLSVQKTVTFIQLLLMMITCYVVLRHKLNAYE